MLFRSVADILNVTLTSEERKRLQQTAKVDPELYNLYLQGISLAKKYTYLDDVEAIRVFDRAIKKDSNYAPVLAGKAFAITCMASWFATVSVADAIQQSDPLYSKSIALDSNLSLAYSSMGWAEMCFKWDFKNAEKYLLKSFSIDPSDDIALSGLVFVYMYGGNYKEANKWWETGKAISPNSQWVDGGHGQTLYLLGKIPEAIQFNKDGIEKYDHIQFYDKLGWLYDLSGQYKEAIEILEKETIKFKARPPSSIAWLASSYYKSGNKIKAQEIFKDLEERVEKKSPDVAIYTAMAYASIGDKQNALRFLDKAYELHDVDMIWLKEDPHFKSLQTEPRYQEMLKKVGF